VAEDGDGLVVVGGGDGDGDDDDGKCVAEGVNAGVCVAIY
jgi:hypothetical protein